MTVDLKRVAQIENAREEKEADLQIALTDEAAEREHVVVLEAKVAAQAAKQAAAQVAAEEASQIAVARVAAEAAASQAARAVVEAQEAQKIKADEAISQLRQAEEAAIALTAARKKAEASGLAVAVKFDTVMSEKLYREIADIISKYDVHHQVVLFALAMAQDTILRKARKAYGIPS